jgi:hypothetical protein
LGASSEGPKTQSKLVGKQVSSCALEPEISSEAATKKAISSEVMGIVFEVKTGASSRNRVGYPSV